MEFIRKRKRGSRTKTRKHWFSDEGYRIIWRKEVFGIKVPPAYQACVRILIPYSGGTLRECWDFVNRKRRLIKTLKAAQKECEAHKQLWTKVCEVTGIRALKELFTKLPIGFPIWVQKKLDRRIYAILVSTQPQKLDRCLENLSPDGDNLSQNDLPETSDTSPICSVESSPQNSTGPVLPVTDEDGSTTQMTRRVRSKVTGIETPSSVPVVEAQEKEQSKPSLRRTTKRSTITTKKRRNTTGSSTYGKKRSRNSRRKKSKL